MYIQIYLCHIDLNYININKFGMYIAWLFPCSWSFGNWPVLFRHKLIFFLEYICWFIPISKCVKFLYSISIIHFFFYYNFYNTHYKLSKHSITLINNYWYTYNNLQYHRFIIFKLNYHIKFYSLTNFFYFNSCFVVITNVGALILYYNEFI